MKGGMNADDTEVDKLALHDCSNDRKLSVGPGVISSHGEWAAFSRIWPEWHDGHKFVASRPVGFRICCRITWSQLRRTFADAYMPQAPRIISKRESSGWRLRPPRSTHLSPIPSSRGLLTISVSSTTSTFSPYVPHPRTNRPTRESSRISVFHHFLAWSHSLMSIWV